MNPALEKVFDVMPTGSAAITCERGNGEAFWKEAVGRPDLAAITLAIMTKTLASLQASITAQLTPEELEQFNTVYAQVMETTPDVETARVETRPPPNTRGSGQ